MIIQAAKIIGSGLATIGLAGAGVGILRLNSCSRMYKYYNLIGYVKNNNLKYNTYIICRQLKTNGLLEGAISNEVLFEGSMNNSRRILTSSPECSVDIAIFKGIAKAKCWFKRGSTPEHGLVIYQIRNVRSPNEKVTNLYLSYTTDSQNYSSTDTCLLKIHNLKVKFGIIYPTTIKSGNLGKIINVIIEVVVNIKKINILWLKNSIDYIKIITLIIKHLNVITTKLSLRTIKVSRLTSWDLWYRCGGKIDEKAKALGNSNDIVKSNPKIYNQNRLRIASIQLASFDRFARRQNSSVFKTDIAKVNTLNITREYSQVDVSSLNDRSMGFKSRPLNQSKLITLIDLREKVFNDQIKLASLAKSHGVRSKIVQRKMEILVRSFDFRKCAVENISSHSGSKTPGLDNYIFESQDDRNKMVEKLLVLLKNYKSSPVKRVFINKKDGKQRPLGIPTIQDRCLQELIRLVLDPIVELNSDDNSYGFRKFRSAKNAIGALRAQLKSNSYQEKRYILDADIKGFFDNISHEWILNNLPLPKSLIKIVESWLKSGIVYMGQYSSTDAGTPQGGVISPTLANFTLNGLEKVVNNSIFPITKSKAQRYVIRNKYGEKKWFSLGITCIRYADDFVILARSRHVIINYIKPKVVEFLNERGLSLNEEKSKIFTINKQELNYLGYTFKYRDNWRIEYSMIKERLGEKCGIALYPSKESLNRIFSKIKSIIKLNQNITAYELISRLNPIIRGWCNYFNVGNSSRSKNRLRQYLYRRLMKWAIQKHRRWGIKKIYWQYFRVEEKFKNRTAVFHGMTLKNSRYTDSDSGKTNYLLDPFDFPTLAANNYNFPNNFKSIHAYDPNYLKLVQFNIDNRIKAMGKFDSIKEKLFKK
jgi:group II intron reverse transcriptase/maturase